ncbi:MAG: replicative DNA helicase [Pseudomonadota bacterium]
MQETYLENTSDILSFQDLSPDELKTPPYSVEAEQAVLGGLMLSEQAWEKISDQVLGDDFFRPEHRLIFAAMGMLLSEKAPLDIVTLSELLARQGQLEEAGGLAYLVELANNTPSAANIEAYAKIVSSYAMRRLLISTAENIINQSYQPAGQDIDELLNAAERDVMGLADKRMQSGAMQSINPLLKSAVEKIDELYKSDSSITGISTGFADLDDMTSGLQKSDLVIVAARPSMGKTSFAMNLVENAILKEDKPCIVFSMEMPAEQLIMRLMSAVGRIDQTVLRSGKLQDADWPKLSHAASQLKDKKLFIDDTPAMSPTEINARARRIAREHGELGMIMIDYLQLMQIKGRSENRTNEISEISRSLKIIAKEFKCPVIALSQLNRSLEQRPNKRPIMSDLRESGAIEQDADIIMFIYRDEVYNEESEAKGTAEIIIGKQRNGPIGTTRLAFIGKYTRFENLAPASYDNF